jgi:hypothetical protein
VLEVGDGVFEVLSTSGDTHLGGDDFDKVYILTCPDFHQYPPTGGKRCVYFKELYFDKVGCLDVIYSVLWIGWHQTLRGMKASSF